MVVNIFWDYPSKTAIAKMFKENSLIFYFIAELFKL